MDEVSHLLNLKKNLISLILEFLDLSELKLLKRVQNKVLFKKTFQYIKEQKINFKGLNLIGTFKYSESISDKIIVSIIPLELKERVYLILFFLNNRVSSFNYYKNAFKHITSNLFENSQINYCIKLSKGESYKKDVIIAACSSNESKNIIIYRLFEKTLLFQLEVNSKIYIIKRLIYENNFYLVTPELHNIVFWDYNKGTKYKTLCQAHKNYIYQILSFEDVKKYMIVSCSYDKAIKIWNTQLESSVNILTNNPVWWISRIKSFNREHFISCENNYLIRVWNVVTRECLMSSNTIKVQSISYLIQPGFMPKDKLFFVSGTLKLIEIKEGKIIGTELIEDIRIVSFCFLTSKGKVLFVCSTYNKELKIYEIIY